MRDLLIRRVSPALVFTASLGAVGHARHLRGRAGVHVANEALRARGITVGEVRHACAIR
ncbi:MAG TPA: hypothetical protein VF516_35500 [Kofleriaceae bacterium]